MTAPLDSNALPSPAELLESARRKYALAQARMRRGPAELALLSLHGSIEDALRAQAIRRRLPAAVAPFLQLVDMLTGDSGMGLEPAEAETIRRMHRLRARVAHGEQISVTAETIANYQRLAARVLPRFGAVVIGPDDLSSPQERAAYNPLDEAPPDVPRRRPSTVSLEREEPPRRRRSTVSMERDEPPPRRTTTSLLREEPIDRRSGRSTSNYPLLDRYPDLARRDMSATDAQIGRAERTAAILGRAQTWLIPALIVISIFLIGVTISFVLQRPSAPEPSVVATDDPAFVPEITTAAVVNSISEVDETSAPTEQPTVTPEPEPTPTGLREGGRAVVIDGIPGLNIRAQPGQSQQIVLNLQPGTEVEVLEGPVDVDGLQWWRVRSAGIEGWCAGDFLDPR